MPKEVIIESVSHIKDPDYEETVCGIDYSNANPDLIISIPPSMDFEDDFCQECLTQAEDHLFPQKIINSHSM
jgi:hypothetical protein